MAWNNHACCMKKTILIIWKWHENIMKIACLYHENIMLISQKWYENVVANSMKIPCFSLATNFQEIKVLDKHSQCVKHVNWDKWYEP